MSALPMPLTPWHAMQVAAFAFPASMSAAKEGRLMLVSKIIRTIKNRTGAPSQGYRKEDYICNVQK